MGIFRYDGLVMVHPTDGRPRNNYYLKNLTQIVRDCNQQKIPIFKIEDGRGNEEIDTLLSDAIPLLTGEDEIVVGRMTEREISECYQRTADKISSRIRKDHMDIDLGFGGTNADQCVYGFSVMLCRYVFTNQGNDRRFEKYKNSLSRPI